MIAIPQSYIQLTTPSYYFTNAEDFDPTLIWYDTSPLLYYAIARYDATDNVFKLITNGKLNGYNNNTNYSYRFNFDKYIKITQNRDPQFIKLNDEQQYFDSYDSCNMYFMLETYDFIAAGGAYYTVKSNGEIWFTNLNGMGGYKWNYLFYDKEDGNTIQFPTCDKLYSNSYVPFTLNDFNPSTTPSGMESENILIYSKVKECGDNNVSSAHTLHTTEGGFRRYTASGGNNVSLYNFITDLVKSPTFGEKWSFGVDMRNNESCNITVQIRNAAQSELYYSSDIFYSANVWKRFKCEGVVTTELAINGLCVVFIVNSTNTVLDQKDFKFEMNSVCTPWTPASTNVTPFLTGNYSYATLTTYNKDGLTNRYFECLQPLSTRTYLQYIDETDVKAYFQDKFGNGRWINIEKSNCNTQPWYFKGINGGIDVLYTNGNQHEVSNVTKDYITIDNKKYNHNINTQKQLKVNTGFEMNEPQIRSLIKSPFLLKPLNDQGTYGKNLILDGAVVNSSFAAGAAGFHFWLDLEERLIPGQTYVCYVDGHSSELTLSREHTYGYEQSIVSGVPFVDVYGARSIRAYHQPYYPTETVRTIKLEKGSVMTPFSLNPQDEHPQNYLIGTLSSLESTPLSNSYSWYCDPAHNDYMYEYIFTFNYTAPTPNTPFSFGWDYLDGSGYSSIVNPTMSGDGFFTFQLPEKNRGNKPVFRLYFGYNTYISAPKINKGTINLPYDRAQQEYPLSYPLRLDTKRYMLDTTSFEGYNGSKLSEKNIELILTDEKISKRKSNFELGFFD